MRLLPSLLRQFSRRYKLSLLSLAVGLVLGWFLFLLLPPQPLATLPGKGPQYSEHLYFSPDGQTLARVYDNFGVERMPDEEPDPEFAKGGTVIQLWDWRRGLKKNFFSLDVDGFLHLAFSPDSQTLAFAPTYGPLHLWKSTSGNDPEVFQSFGEKQVSCSLDHLFFTPQGQLRLILCPTWVPVSELWEWPANKRLKNWPRKYRTFQWQQHFMVEEGADSLKLWDLNKIKEIKATIAEEDLKILGKSQEESNEEVEDKRFGTTINLPAHGGEILLNSATGQFHKVDESLGRGLLSPDGRWLICTTGSGLIGSGSWQEKLFETIAPRLLSGGAEDIYELSTGRKAGSIPWDGFLVFSADGNLLAQQSLEEGDVHVWSVPPDKPWTKILGGALLAAAVVFLGGCGLGRWHQRSTPSNSQSISPF